MPPSDSCPADSLGLIDLGSSDAESDRRLQDGFVATAFVRAAAEGRRTIMLGPKGSGKSALFLRLPEVMAQGIGAPNVVVLLTPDDFDWRAVRAHREDGVPAEAAFRRAWSYTLAFKVAEALVAHGSMARWRGPIRRLRRYLRRAERGGPTSSTLRVSLSAFGVGVAAERGSGKAEEVDRATAALLDVLEPALTGHRVVVAFDRLDEDWDGSDASRSALVGLLMAAKALNDRLGRRTDGGLTVFTFLRTDVYDALLFDDKDKYRSFEETLLWDADSLRELLEKRLPHGRSVESVLATDHEAGRAAFLRIVDTTFRRPRDILQLVDAALHAADPEDVALPPQALEAAIARFSRWKTADLAQEYGSTTPGYVELLEALRGGPASYASRHALEVRLARNAFEAYERLRIPGAVQRLFETSAIGFVSGATVPRFRCDDPLLTLPRDSRLHVHPALHAGLDLTEVDSVDAEEAWIGAEWAEDTVVLVARGDLDYFTARWLREISDDCLGARPRGMIVDLSAVTLMDSSVLTALLELKRRCLEASVWLAIAGPLSLAVERILQITGVGEAFSIFGTRTAAAQAASEHMRPRAE